MIVRTLAEAKIAGSVMAMDNLAVVYRYQAKRDGKMHYALFRTWVAAERWLNSTNYIVTVVYTSREGWIDES